LSKLYIFTTHIDILQVNGDNMIEFIPGYCHEHVQDKYSK